MVKSKASMTSQLAPCIDYSKRIGRMKDVDRRALEMYLLIYFIYPNIQGCPLLQTSPIKTQHIHIARDPRQLENHSISPNLSHSLPISPRLLKKNNRGLSGLQRASSDSQKSGIPEFGNSGILSGWFYSFFSFSFFGVFIFSFHACSHASTCTRHCSRIRKSVSKRIIG